MVSVCMATYNGEKFVKRQLDSIISQLSENDEIVIVDDCSTDETVRIIHELDFPNIRIEVNEENLGFVGSFNKAMTLAKGDYIFLSDQDDIWFDNKVQTILPLLEAGCDLVVHDAIVVDGELKELSPSIGTFLHINRHQGLIGNLYLNAHAGCMMAFNRRLRDASTPVPSMMEGHDHWIFLVAKMAKKDINILDKQLMYFIRHGNNATGFKTRSIWKMISGRLATIKAMIQYKN